MSCLPSRFFEFAKRASQVSLPTLLLNVHRLGINVNISLDISIQNEYNFIIEFWGKPVDWEGGTLKYHKTVYQALMMVTQFGVNMLVPIFLCSFVGMFLDRKLGTNVWMVALFFVGALAGFTNVFRFARKIYETPARTRRRSVKMRKETDDNEKKD